MPLAIIQAAAYLRETQEDISSYIEIYRRSWNSIWDWKPDQGRETYVSIATVLSFSFKNIKHRQESFRLLCFISFLAPDDLPERLWMSDPKIQDETLRKIFLTRADFNNALGPLCAYSFVKRSSTSHGISIHRMVQDVMRDIIERRIPDEGSILGALSVHEATPEYWISRTAETLTSAYPNSDIPENWDMCDLLVTILLPF